MERLNSYIDSNTIVTTGVGVHQMLAAQYLDMPGPKSFLTSGSFGTMGFSMPAAVGAAFANPQSTIISIDGDGGFKMNEGELNTIMEYNLPVKIIVLNNKGDGMVKNWQDAFYKETGYVATERSYDTRFADIAKAHGFPWAERVDQKTQLGSSLSTFMSQEGPAVLEVVTDPEEAVYPRIFPGRTYAEMELGPFITERK